MRGADGAVVFAFGEDDVGVGGGGALADSGEYVHAGNLRGLAAANTTKGRNA